VPGADELRDGLKALLGTSIGDLQRLPGGASRETWSFTSGEQRFVLRRDPPGAPSQGDRAGEVHLLRKAAEQRVPVPEIVRSFTADELGSSGFVMRFVEGETIARRILRDEVYAKARDVMAAQCGEILARIHRMPTEGMEVSPAPEVLDRYRALHDSLGEPHPAFELGMRWLEQRMPGTRGVTFVHGDFRNGNLIVGPEGVRAVIDWELAHAGDPYEDLAWLCLRAWRFGGPGEVGGFGNREDLYASYERESGHPIDRDAVRWWEALNTFKWGVMTQVQAHTHLWGHVRSVELAAIGRRTVECEYDLLNLIA
jgi:aminoglycoside phosphotransferase (APT) family kinase protein